MNGKSLMFSIFPSVRPSRQKTDHAFSLLLAPFSLLLCPLPRSPEGALEINRGCDPRSTRPLILLSPAPQRGVGHPSRDTAGEMPAAACARRSSIGLTQQSLVNQALRRLEPPSYPEPGALAPGGSDRKVNSPAVSLSLSVFSSLLFPRPSGAQGRGGRHSLAGGYTPGYQHHAPPGRAPSCDFAVSFLRFCHFCQSSCQFCQRPLVRAGKKDA